MINVKFTFPDQRIATKQIKDDSDLQSLLAYLNSLKEEEGGYSVPAQSKLQLLIGFPPALVQGKSSDSLLDLGIKQGAKIIIREGEPCSLLDSVIKPEVAGNGGKQDVRSNLMSLFRISSVVDEGMAIAGDDYELAKEVIEGILEAKGLETRATMVRRVVEADNSCMFNSIGYLMNKMRHNTSLGIDYSSQYREMIKMQVLSDKEKYNSAFLGKDNEEYAAWITNKEKWGGEIEMSILSMLLSVQISAIDIQTNLVFNYGDGFDKRIFLLYDGIHYDAMARASASDASEEDDQTIFSSSDSEAELGCKEIAQNLKRQKLFVNLSGCDLQCLVCGAGLKGQKEAQEHAKITAHQNFAAV